jgi:hypothetical protein
LPPGGDCFEHRELNDGRNALSLSAALAIREAAHRRVGKVM